jgi:hypothetical protein
MGQDLERLKLRIPLLEYLQRHHWSGRPVGARSEFVGLCPLHADTRPSFYVNPRKHLFYCHGCEQGGDLIRFVQLSQHLSFRQSVAYLQEELAPTAQLLPHAAAFYQVELHRYPDGIQYLAQRGVHDAALIEEFGLGDARGGNLRAHLQELGYPLERLLEVGLIGPQGQDAFCRRVIFPCRQQDRIVNLYGRSIGDAFPHRLLPRSKGGLFAWESVRQFRRRGHPMTAAGLRSLFRHHRLVSKVSQANPHRFRHTFGSDMVRAGISLPALMHLMGHADIHTTMLYVQLAPEDVWREFARAVQQRVRLSPPEKMP